MISSRLKSISIYEIQKFEDVIAWQKTQNLAVIVYKAFDSLRDFGFIKIKFKEHKKALKESEVYKINCGMKHFATLGVEVQYKAPAKDYQHSKADAVNYMTNKTGK